MLSFPGTHRILFSLPPYENGEGECITIPYPHNRLALNFLFPAEFDSCVASDARRLFQAQYYDMLLVIKQQHIPFIFLLK